MEDVSASNISNSTESEGLENISNRKNSLKSSVPIDSKDIHENNKKVNSRGFTIIKIIAASGLIFLAVITSVICIKRKKVVIENLV